MRISDLVDGDTRVSFRESPRDASPAEQVSKKESDQVVGDDRGGTHIFEVLHVQ